jgi:hypothetical protein
VSAQQTPRLVVDRDERLTEPACVVGEELLGEQEHVVAALAQRRDPDREHVEAVEQVGAERSLRDRLLEGAVGRRDHAHVDADRAPTQALDLAFLQNAQQRDLRLERQLADLVEQDRAAIRHFEATDSFL